MWDYWEMMDQLADIGLLLFHICIHGWCRHYSILYHSHFTNLYPIPLTSPRAFRPETAFYRVKHWVECVKNKRHTSFFHMGYLFCNFSDL